MSELMDILHHIFGNLTKTGVDYVGAGDISQRPGAINVQST